MPQDLSSSKNDSFENKTDDLSQNNSKLESSLYWKPLRLSFSEKAISFIEKQFLSKIKSAAKNETDTVEPVEIEVVEVLPNGMMTIHFSERLKTFLEMS